MFSESRKDSKTFWSCSEHYYRFLLHFFILQSLFFNSDPKHFKFYTLPKFHCISYVTFFTVRYPHCASKIHNRSTITIQKKRLCVTQSQFFYVLVSIHDSFFNALQGRNETISQPDASMQTCIFRVENVCNAYLHYEQTLSNAIHHTSNVSLLQESVNFAVTYRNRTHFIC